MVKEHKIIKYNLQDEVDQLQTMGMAYHEIASKIKENHPDIADLSNLSAMAIQRYLASSRETKIIEDVKQGKDPVTDFIGEYRQAMKDINEKTETLYNKSIKVLNDIELTNDDIMRLKAIKEVRDNIEQIRKNQVSLVQFGEKKTNTIYNVNLKKEIHVKNLLLNFVKGLCPKCKRNVSEILEEVV